MSQPQVHEGEAGRNGTSQQWEGRRAAGTGLWGHGGFSHQAWLTGPFPADAPQLMELPRDVTVELGRSALLACRAMGRPPPLVTWRRGDGQPLGPRRGSRTGQPDLGVLFFESKTLGEGRVGKGDSTASDILSPQARWLGAEP